MCASLLSPLLHLSLQTLKMAAAELREISSEAEATYKVRGMHGGVFLLMGQDVP